MKIKTTLIASLILLVLSCAEDEPGTGLNDNDGPTIFFTSPDNNSIVSDTVYITCESADASGVYKVELWINNDSTSIADETEPYVLSWATNDYQNGQYSIVAMDGQIIKQGRNLQAVLQILNKKLFKII